MKPLVIIKLILSTVFIFFLASCATSPASVSEDELYSLGKAYFDLGKYSEAEVWFQRASKFKKTEAAASYYLGRIAFLQQRYTDAARIFEDLLQQDKDNIILLKAAAFSYLKALDYEKAEYLYKRVVSLLPDSKESTYGYALVLYGLQKYSEAYSILKNVNADLSEDRDALLLLARIEHKLGYPEALDHYSKWLEHGEDPLVMKEYAEVAEQQSLYSRAIEAYKKIKQTNREETAGLKKGETDFLIGKLLLIADPADSQGLKQIELALSSGYDDKEQFEKLLSDSRLLEDQRQALNSLFSEKNK